MASELAGTQRARGISPTRLVDAHRRVRAAVESDGQDATLTFYDERGAVSETVRGVLSVSAALFRMLKDPAYHPEIVGGAPPLSTGELVAPPPGAPLHRLPDE